MAPDGSQTGMKAGTREVFGESLRVHLPGLGSGRGFFANDTKGTGDKRKRGRSGFHKHDELLAAENTGTEVE